MDAFLSSSGREGRHFQARGTRKQWFPCQGWDFWDGLTRLPRKVEVHHSLLYKLLLWLPVCDLNTAPRWALYPSTPAALQVPCRNFSTPGEAVQLSANCKEAMASLRSSHWVCEILNHLKNPKLDRAAYGADTRKDMKDVYVWKRESKTTSAPHLSYHCQFLPHLLL